MTLTAARTGGASLIAGSLLLAAYAILFTVLLPVPRTPVEYAQVLVSPAWRPLALLAFAGVLLMIPGVFAVYLAVRPPIGLAAAIGLGCAELACFFQGCYLTWEIFIDPVIAAHPASAFLLRDAVLLKDPWVAAFRWVALGCLVAGAVSVCAMLLRSRAFSRAPILLILFGALAYAGGPFASAAGPRLAALVTVGGVLFFAAGGCLVGYQIWRAGAGAANQL